MEKIIFDTDIGSDIDDAFALGYLLNHPECELLGITTVSGKTGGAVSAVCRSQRKNRTRAQWHQQADCL